jgi:hypothetical protein
VVSEIREGGISMGYYNLRKLIHEGMDEEEFEKTVFISLRNGYIDVYQMKTLMDVKEDVIGHE